VPISLVTAFRQQFPEGSLLSEVLTIHDGLFVVRVSVSVHGQVLSQALGGNNSLELAEDIACNRALEKLALTAQTATPSLPEKTSAQPNGASQEATVSSESRLEPPQAKAGPSPQAVPAPTNGAAAGFPFQQTNGAPLPVVESLAPAEGAPIEPTENPTVAVPDAAVSCPLKVPPPVLQLATPPATKVSEEDAAVNPQKEGAVPSGGYDQQDFSNFSTNPVDLSDIIAQTDVELQRLRWDVHQGREFLEKTYSKRSRHDLTDEELLEFLLYLESQPTPSP
jgi:hypothetical protein